MIHEKFKSFYSYSGIRYIDKGDYMKKQLSFFVFLITQFPSILSTSSPHALIVHRVVQSREGIVISESQPVDYTPGVLIGIPKEYTLKQITYIMGFSGCPH